MSAYDRWKQTDPSDDGSQEAIDRIYDQLAVDGEAVDEAVAFLDDKLLPLLCDAFIAGTEAGWKKATDRIRDLIGERLMVMAGEQYDAEQEEARWGGMEDAA